MEIDNYDTDPHIKVKLGSQNMVLTYHTPEALSAEQENYLQTQWNAIAKAICSNNENDTEWEKYVDIESLAKVYIVRELLQDEEGFHGSCYLYIVMQGQLLVLLILPADIEPSRKQQADKGSEYQSDHGDNSHKYTPPPFFDSIPKKFIIDYLL